MMRVYSVFICDRGHTYAGMHGGGTVPPIIVLKKLSYNQNNVNIRVCVVQMVGLILVIFV